MGVYVQMMLRVRALAPQVLPELAQKAGAARVFCSGGGSAGAAGLAVERRVATALKVHRTSHCVQGDPTVQIHSASLVQKNRPAWLAGFVCTSLRPETAMTLARHPAELEQCPWQASGCELRACASDTLCHRDDLPFRPTATPATQGAPLTQQLPPGDVEVAKCPLLSTETCEAMMATAMLLGDVAPVANSLGLVQQTPPDAICRCTGCRLCNPYCIP